MDKGEFRIKEHLGIVTSDASTGKFRFFVTPLKNRVEVAKGDFVVVDHPAFGELCPLLGVVKEVSRSRIPPNSNKSPSLLISFFRSNNREHPQTTRRRKLRQKPT